MLKQRIVTAVWLVPLFIAAVLFLPPVAFFVLTAVLVVLASFEWSSLMGLNQFPQNIIYPLTMIIILSILPFFFSRHILSIEHILYAACLFWLYAAALVIAYPKGNRILQLGFLPRAIMGILVLLPSCYALNWLRNFPHHGIEILLYFFILIWGADTGAYFVGKKWGKNKLLPNVSPGKTWEGLLGALLTATVIIAIALYYFKMSRSEFFGFYILGLVTVLFSILGDFFESMLKRNVGLKDSGKCLPGHGGILDRIDSLTASAPIFALGAMWLGK